MPQDCVETLTRLQGGFRKMSFTWRNSIKIAIKIEKEKLLCYVILDELIISFGKQMEHKTVLPKECADVWRF